jgi:ribosomal protein S18 acetylase RimI-like enzyme
MKRYIRCSTNDIYLKSIGHEFFSDGDVEDYHRYLIMRNDTKVGNVEIIDRFNDDNDICYIDRIDVDDEYQNQGIGTYVLTNLLDGLGFRDVVVAPDNSDAERLYRRLGTPLNDNFLDTECDFGYNDQGFGVYVI